MSKSQPKITIAIDVDDTIANTRKALVLLYRAAHLTPLYNPITNHDYSVHCPEWTRDKVTSVFTEPYLFDYLEPFDGAVEFWTNLKHRFDVELTLNTLHLSRGIYYKDLWLDRNFPNVFDNRIYLTSLKHNKDLVVADIIVDDNIKNLATNRSTYRILFDHYGIYRNQEIPEGIIVCETYEQLEVVINYACLFFSMQRGE